MGKIKKISTKVITIFVISLIVLLGFFGHIIYMTFDVSKEVNRTIPGAIENVKKDSQLDSFADQIRYLDEVLTQSARNYAYTGDVQWKERYNHSVPELDVAIKETIRKGDDKDKEIFASIDDANLKLVKMETQSIESVDKGSLTEAQQILNSKEYTKQKQIYQEGLEEYFSKRGTDFHENLYISLDPISEIVDDVQGDSRQIQISVIAISVFLVGLLGFLYFFLIKFIIKRLEIVNRSAKSIAEGNFNQRITLVSKDEIGDLSESFNKMSENLQESWSAVDRKVQEQTEEIKEAKVKDDAYLESIGDGVVAVDKKEKIILTNRQAELIIGLAKDQLMDQKMSEKVQLFDENGRLINKEERPIKNVLKTGKKHTSISYYIKKNNKLTPLALTTAPIVLDGETIGAIDVFRDITQEKQIDKAKTEFVSLASHQLRTPLSAVNWYAEMLIAGDVGKLNEEQKKYVGEIYKGNQRMVDLVNALLNVSRIELGTFAVEPSPTDLTEIAKSLLKELEPDINKRKQEVQEKYDKNLGKINVDPKLIRIVIQNLLSNAVKYSPQNSKISISILCKEQYIEIKVSDTGYGIPKTQQKDIFTKLFRADNVREKDTEGTGLGLYIVKNIVEQSGGKIWFKSVENQGTTFYVQIPFKGMKRKEGTKALEDIK